jgi:quercetin dioxygenase-like cupin family protein
VTDRKWDIYYAEFPRAAKPSDPHQHAGAEFVYVINGGVVVGIGGKNVVLNEGDAVHFDSSVAHSYRLGDPQKSSSVIVVVMPEGN